MSKVAKKIIVLPANVKLSLSTDSMTLTGPKGSLTQHFNNKVNISIDDNDSNKIIFAPKNNNVEAWKHAGTARALMNNMIQGVTTGYAKTLELVGVGYRAQASGNTIALSLGFSHPIDYKLPDNVKAETPNNTTINLISICKQSIGQVAAKIRSFRPPEPYKGKGIRYLGEKLTLKDAKKK